MPDEVTELAANSASIAPEISDPYFAWSQLGGKADFQEQTQYLVAYESDRSPPANPPVVEGASAALENPLEAEFQSTSPSPGFSIIWHPIWWNTTHSYGTATVDTQGLNYFQKLVKDKKITRFEVSLMPRQVRSWRGFKQPNISSGTTAIPVTESKILYGVIDLGLPFAHPGLQCQDRKSSRILSAWYQEEQAGPVSSAIAAVQSPKDFGFGQAIDSFNLSKLYPSSSEDWRTYASLGLPELRRDYSHGSHILGGLLEAQRSPSLQWSSWKNGAALDANPSYRLPNKPDTVFVQLPHAYTEHLNRSAIGAYRLSAMRYILACAGEKTNVCERIVIPVSSEDYVGSHDGTSLFEMAVDALVEYATSEKGKELLIFFAAGNSLRMRTHEPMPEVATEPPSQLKTYQSKVRVFPSNELATYVEIWLNKAYDELNINITPTTPNKDVKINATLKKSQIAFYADPASKVRLISVLNFHIQKQQLLLVRLPPSYSLDQSNSVLASNDWKINISSAKNGEAIDAHAYVARSFSGFTGSLRSYQSQFLQKSKVTNNMPDDLLIDLPDYGKGSLNGMANGGKIKVIGGYQIWYANMNDAALRRRAYYSAAGPSRGGIRLKGTAVDALAPSDESPHLIGIRHWGNRSASTFRLAGSSIATPIAAQSVARDKVTLTPLPANDNVDNFIGCEKILSL